MKTADITADSSYLNDDVFAPDTLGDYFTTDGIYNGKSQKPTITLAGAKALWGLEPSDPNDEEAVKTFLDSLYGTKYTVEWQAGTYANYNGNTTTQISNGDYKGVVAGKHYYRIVDVDTGSVICYKHLCGIKPVEIDAVEIELTTAGYDGCVGFEGKTLAWKGTLKGINSEGKNTTVANFSLSKTLDYNDAGTTKAYDTNTLEDFVNNAPLTWEGNSQITANNHKISNTLKYVAECYVLPTTKTSGGKYFGSLGAAIDVTTSGTIYPMQSFHYSIKLLNGEVKATTQDNPDTEANEDAPVTVGTGLTSGDYTHVLKDNQYTIQPNVTLCIPYGTGTSYFGDADKLDNAKRNAYHNTTYLKNVVRIEAVKNDKGELIPTLINNGKIQITGQVNGAQSTYTSVTAGLHSQITLGENAILQNTTGSIKCHGFIDAETFGNGSKVDMDGGTIELVISLVEHYGGKKLLDISSNANNKVTPFNRFYVQSVTADLNVSNNANVTGYADIYINTVKSHVDQTINLFGNADGSFIQFTANNTSLNLTFNPNTEQNELYVKGSVKVNKITISKTILFIYDVNLTTEGLYMPISHYWDITFDVADGNKTATVDSENQHIRVMPGASITIEKGVTFNGNELIVYEGAALQFNPPNNYNYYTKANGTAVSQTDGVLLVKGSLNVKKLGGYVQAQNGATLSMATSNEATVTELIYIPKADGSAYEYTTIDITRTATGEVWKNATVADKKELTANANYIYEFVETAWFQPFVTLTLDANGGKPNTTSVDLPVDRDEGITDLSNLSKVVSPPERTDYKFTQKWYLDSACEQPIEDYASQIKYDTTLYAGWTLNMATTVVFNTMNGSAVTGDAVSVTVTTTGISEEDFNKVNSKTSTLSGYDFNGWYTDSTCTTKITPEWFVQNNFSGDKQITVYAGWTKTDVIYTITLDSNIGDKTELKGVSFGENGSVKIGSVAGLPTTHDVNYNTAIQYYFVGWSTSATATEPDSSITLSEGLKLYAVWAQKSYRLNVTGNSEANIPEKNIEFSGYLYFIESQLKNEVDLADVLKTYQDLADDYDTDSKANKYFGGWSKAKVSLTDFAKNESTGFNESSVEAQWLSKHVLTIDICEFGSYCGCTATVTVVQNGTSNSYTKTDELYFNPTENVTVSAKLKGYYFNYWVGSTTHTTLLKAEGGIADTESSSSGSEKTWKGGALDLSKDSTTIEITNNG